MINKFFSNLLLFLLVSGIFVTVFGLTQFSWVNTLSWSKEGFWSYFVFFTTCLTTILIGSFKSKKNAFNVAGMLAFAIILLSGTIWPVLVAAWFFASSLLVGRAVFSILKFPETTFEWVFSLLIGAGLYGTAVGLIAHFPINYPGVYGAALVLPIFLNWRFMKSFSGSVKERLFLHKAEDQVIVYPYDVLIASVALVHFVVGLMPELGHDALATHLFVPVHLATRHEWGFDAGTYVWAVIPMLGDMIFAIGYMLGGETAARVINTGFIFVIAYLVRCLVLWAGGSAKGAKWAALIFLSTPLTFTESSQLFIESIWAAYVVGGTLAVLRLSTASGQSKYNFTLAALMFGLAAGTKAVTLPMLVIMLLIIMVSYRAWFSVSELLPMVIATCMFLAVASIPYATAWWHTGNPVFPFFNAIFKSSYYPLMNFDASHFGKGVTWDILYRLTFDSSKYLEASTGAAGFQWLLLFLPATVILISEKQHKGLMLLLVGVSYVVVVFYSTAYLRYVFPAWIIISSFLGLAMGLACNSSNLTKKLILFSASMTIALNLLLLNAGSQYWDFPLTSIFDKSLRDGYLEKRLPIRNAVELVNRLNRDKTPVAIFSHSLGAGLESDALYANWYNYKFQNQINSSSTPSAVSNVLLQYGVNFIILDSSLKGGSEKFNLIKEATELVAEFGSLSIRRVNASYQFETELLNDPDFTNIQSWSLSPGASYNPLTKSLIVNVNSPASQTVAVLPRQRYLNSVIAKCHKESSQGRLQINWIDVNGKFINTNIKVFDCMPNLTEYSMEVTAPINAAAAIIYVASHTETPVQFAANSLKK